jgi:hypothetical protein
VWAKYDDGKAWEKAPVVRSLVPKQICGPGKDISLNFGEHLDKSHGSYLQLKIHAEQPCRVTVTVPGRSESRIEFNVLNEREASDYVIRLSCLWAWMNDGDGKISLRSEAPIWVQEAILRKAAD